MSCFAVLERAFFADFVQRGGCEGTERGLAVHRRAFEADFRWRGA